MLGRTTGETDTINGSATTISGVVPDALGRLTAATVNGTASHWSYDTIGNLATPTVGGVARTYTYSTSSPNELTSMATSGGATLQYVYDSDGHTTVITTDASTSNVCSSSGQPSDGNTTCLEYDPEGRLTQAWMGAQNLIVTISYSPEGQRSSYQVFNSQRVLQYGYDYTYQGSQLVGLTRIGTGPYQEQFIYGPTGTPLELIYVPLLGTSSPCGSTVECRYWYETNGHGDVVALTDVSGNVVDRYHYDLWGVPTTDLETAPQPLRYAGYLYDSELRDPTQAGGSGTGWYWLAVRGYDPRLERFLQPDPSQQEGVETYAYCNDDPLDCTDPTGLLSWDDVGSWAHNTLYNTAQAAAGGLDYLTLGGFSTVAGAFGAQVDKDSTSYKVGYWATAIAVLLLSAGSSASTAADAAVGTELSTELQLTETTTAVVPTTAIGVGRDAGGYLEFAHGTSLESALAITTNGLNEGAARNLSRGGLYGQPGSFFTFNVTEGGQEAVQVAYEMGLRQASEPVVLRGQLPQSVYQSLTEAGHVSIAPIPGFSVPQTVFSPATFPSLNASMQWRIQDPYGRI